MTEQAGHLNAPDLVEECARAAVDGYHEGNADWDDVNEMERLRGVFCAKRRPIRTPQARIANDTGSGTARR